MTSPSPHPRPTPTVRTRPQLDALLENIAALQRERADLLAAQEKGARRHSRQRYRAPLTEVEDFSPRRDELGRNLGADAHPGSHCRPPRSHPHVGAGARHARLPRRAAAASTAPAAAGPGRASHGALADLAMGPAATSASPAPEVDKDAHRPRPRAIVSPADLRAAGMIITQGETFFIEPHDARTHFSGGGVKRGISPGGHALLRSLSAHIAPRFFNTGRTTRLSFPNFIWERPLANPAKFHFAPA